MLHILILPYTLIHARAHVFFYNNEKNRKKTRVNAARRSAYRKQAINLASHYNEGLGCQLYDN